MEIIDIRIDNMRNSLVNAISDIIKIRSVVDFPTEGAPYGKEIHRVLCLAKEIAKGLGFESVDMDGHGIFVETGPGEEIVGVFGHLDVVPEGEGWIYPPFGGEIHEGRLYGRGAVDNKGPSMECLFGLKALVDSGLPLKRKIRLFLGVDEETGVRDIKYYISRYGAPFIGFNPDGAFPVSFAEKGVLGVKMSGEFSVPQNGSIRLVSLSGGSNNYMIPDVCGAILTAENESAAKCAEQIISDYIESSGYEISFKRNGLIFDITSKGVTGHSYYPHHGKNAIAQLFSLFDTIGLSGDAGNFLRILSQKLAMEGDGCSLGVKFNDETGDLTLVLSILKIDEKGFHAFISIFHPVGYKSEHLQADIRHGFKDIPKNSSFEFKTAPAIYYLKDHILIQTLSRVYNEVTGLDATPIAAGGTYAKYVPNTVSFGSVFPGTPDMGHQRNENVPIDEIVLCAKIYANAMYALCSL